MKIGAQYYTIRDFCGNMTDFEASCKKISEMGYRAIQLSGTGDFTAEELLPVLEKYGLYVVCTHRPPKNYIENLEGEIAFHRALGCKVLGLGSVPRSEKGWRTSVEEFIKNFKPVVERLAKEGMIFAYHNHAWEFEKLDGKYIYDHLREAIPNDNFRVILDVYWLAYAGIDPAKFIRTHKNDIACLHYKDLKIIQNQPNYAEVGVGNLDWDDIIAATKEADIPYALVEQDFCERDPFDCLETSYRYLSGKGLEA